jgi:outer membrane biosynthesis protein TonB
MKKQLRSLWFMSALALFLIVGIGLNAQQATPPAQPPDAQAQQPSTPDQAPPPATTDQAQPSQTPSQTPGQTPDQKGQTTPQASTESAQPSAVQSFTGTVVKSGDKYVLQDADTGNTYDVDHQDEVAKFEGKRVKVKGTLDASGKMIHIQ